MKRYKGKAEILAVGPEILAFLKAGHTVLEVFDILKARGAITISQAAFYRQVGRLKASSRDRTASTPSGEKHFLKSNNETRRPSAHEVDKAPFAIRRPDFDPAKKAKI